MTDVLNDEEITTTFAGVPTRAQDQDADGTDGDDADGDGRRRHRRGRHRRRRVRRRRRRHRRRRRRDGTDGDGDDRRRRADAAGALARCVGTSRPSSPSTGRGPAPAARADTGGVRRPARARRRRPHRHVDRPARSWPAPGAGRQARRPPRRYTRTATIGSRTVPTSSTPAGSSTCSTGGATIVLQGLQRSWAPLRAFCRDLELALTHRVQANAYLTPPGAQGLRVAPRHPRRVRAADARAQALGGLRAARRGTAARPGLVGRRRARPQPVARR